jgi:DNA modification methylase
MMTEKKQATLKIERLELSELQAHPRNPRNHPEPGSKEWEALRRSLESDYFDPIVWNKTNGYLVSGHLRVKVLREAGYDSADAVVKEYDENTHMARMICANQQAGEDDMPALGRLLEELKATDTDSALVGFSEDQIDAILADLNPPEIVEDDVPEPPETAKTELGRMYQIGKHRLMCGDSTSEKDVARLMCGEKADMVFTDPPYNIDYQGVSDKREKIKNDNMGDDDFVEFLSASVPLCGTMYVCHSWQHSHLFRKAIETNGAKIKALIVWDKVNPAQHLDLYYKQHELIWYVGKMGGNATVRGDVWKIKRERNTVHPTMKPVALVAMALGDQPECIQVYDPFGGSGTTLIACEQTNRSCYMMELDPRYCDVIVRRWAAIVGADADEIFKTGFANV